MWVVPLENRIPSKTPDGHQVTSLGFVVRFRGAGEYKAINFFDNVTIQVFTSSGRALPDLMHGSLGLPAVKDVRPLAGNAIAQRAYEILLEDHTLTFFDLDGNVHHFRGVVKGRYRVAVTFADPLKDRWKIETEFEERWGLDEGFFYRGPATRSFEIEIGDIGKK